MKTEFLHRLEKELEYGGHMVPITALAMPSHNLAVLSAASEGWIHLLHTLRQFYLIGEEVQRSLEWLIKSLIKVGAKVAYHGRRWQVHVGSAFPLARHYRAVLG